MAKINTRMLAGAVIGAAAVAVTITMAERYNTAPDGGMGQAEAGKEKCFGVTLAGENACASANGEHNCGGEAKIDYEGHDWTLVAAGTCGQMGGKLEAFEGVSKPPSSTASPSNG